MIYLIKNETPDTKNLVTKTNFDAKYAEIEINYQILLLLI